MANTFRIGDLEVIVVSDGAARAPATVYFQGTTQEQWEPHKRWLDHQGNVEFPFSCFLIRSGGKNVLIDTGLGQINMFGFTGGSLVSELAAAGVQPDDVDVVFVTHLHIDHAGTVISEGRPTFPKALHRWSSGELDYWASPEVQQRGNGPSGFSQTDMQKLVQNQFEAADDGASLAPGINVISTPGHTPGHAAVVLSSGDQRAFILGDAIACPAQLEQPEWSGMGDVDPKLARRTQEAVAKEAEASGALLTAAHFPGLTFGRVLMGEGRRYWSPV